VVDLFGLMVAPSEMQKLAISAFPGDQCQDALYRERASVYKIAIEEILVSEGWVAVDFEDVHEIVVLAMDISADCKLLLVLNFIVYE
jgi:hypothetical protein